MGYFENNFFLIALTFGAFLLGKLIQNKTKNILLNPILFAIIVIIVVLRVTGVSYEHYHQSSSIVEFWLKPSVVALGVPLYLQLKVIRKQWLPIILSQLAGCLVGLVSVILIARILGASKQVISSLAPKSVTTPIAIEVSQALGGIPSLTASVVIIVGLFGAMFGFKILQVGRIRNPIAQGLSMGAASHAVGTSRSMEVSEKYGAYAGLGLILNGILTAILAPYVVALLELL